MRRVGRGSKVGRRARDLAGLGIGRGVSGRVGLG